MDKVQGRAAALERPRYSVTLIAVDVACTARANWIERIHTSVISIHSGLGGFVLPLDSQT